jgi:hypothetical protein
MVIIETPIFTRRIQSILADDEYWLLQAQLVQKPDAGRLFPEAEISANFGDLRVVMESVVALGLFTVG